MVGDRWRSGDLAYGAFASLASVSPPIIIIFFFLK